MANNNLLHWADMIEKRAYSGPEAGRSMFATPRYDDAPHIDIGRASQIDIRGHQPIISTMAPPAFNPQAAPIDLRKGGYRSPGLRPSVSTSPAVPGWMKRLLSYRSVGGWDPLAGFKASPLGAWISKWIGGGNQRQPQRQPQYGVPTQQPQQPQPSQPPSAGVNTSPLDWQRMTEMPNPLLM